MQNGYNCRQQFSTPIKQEAFMAFYLIKNNSPYDMNIILDSRCSYLTNGSIVV